MRERYSFRFTQDEIDEMENILKEKLYARPSVDEIKALATKFSKVRHQQGKNYARTESVWNWFKRRRHAIGKAKKFASSKVTKSMRTILTAAPTPAPTENQIQIDSGSSGEEMSEERNSDEGSSEEKSSESENSREGMSVPNAPANNVSNSVETMDVSTQLELSPQSPLSKTDSVLARLAKFKKVQPEACIMSALDKPTSLTSSSTVDQAKSTLERLKGISLVDFKSYQKDFGLAIQILLEKGSLADSQKTELMLLQQQIVKTAEDNEQARIELSNCESFREKLQETEENTNKLTEKAGLLEEKYNEIPQQMSTCTSKIAELEAALQQAKADAEKLKCDREDVADSLAKLSESLEVSNIQHKILKAEEASVADKRIKAEHLLRKNSEEWVKLTYPNKFTFI